MSVLIALFSYVILLYLVSSNINESLHRSVICYCCCLPTDIEVYFVWKCL